MTPAELPVIAAFSSGSAELANLSIRLQVNAGEKAMIGGFIIAGDAAKDSRNPRARTFPGQQRRLAAAAASCTRSCGCERYDHHAKQRVGGRPIGSNSSLRE